MKEKELVKLETELDKVKALELALDAAQTNPKKSVIIKSKLSEFPSRLDLEKTIIDERMRKRDLKIAEVAKIRARLRKEYDIDQPSLVKKARDILRAIGVRQVACGLKLDPAFFLDLTVATGEDFNHCVETGAEMYTREILALERELERAA